MAGPERITDLTNLAAADIASNDLFIVVDSSEGTDKNITIADAATRFTGLVSGGGTTTAGAVVFTPVGTIAGADVQTAVAEVATDAIARETGISQSLQTTSLYALSIAQSLNTTSTFLSLTSAAATVAIANLALTSSAVNTNITQIATNLTALQTTAAVVSGHIASTTVVHGIADTATLLRTGSIGVTVQAFDANITTTGILIQQIRTVTTTNYTLVVGDLNNIVEMNTATCQVVFPAGLTNSTGVRVDVVQIGATANVTLAASGTTTIHVRSPQTLVMRGQYAVATLYYRGANEWVGSGDLT